MRHRTMVVVVLVAVTGAVVITWRSFETPPTDDPQSAASAPVSEKDGPRDERDPTLKADAVSRDDPAREAPQFPVAPELRDVEEWINTDPFRLADLRGRVVALHYWTYG